VHALRILFNCAFRLADSLGPSWVLVVEVLCTLDRLLPAAGAGGGAKVGTTGTAGSACTDQALCLCLCFTYCYASSADTYLPLCVASALMACATQQHALPCCLMLAQLTHTV
jgi:hypothetical protein